MSQNLNNITIDSINPVKSVGEDLRGCYFVYDWSNDTYSFFEKGSEIPLRTDLKKGRHFTFRLSDHPHIEWTLHISKDSTFNMVEGKWKEKHKHKKDLSGDGYAPEPEQSYQATAGGGAAVEGETSIATAAA